MGRAERTATIGDDLRPGIFWGAVAGIALLLLAYFRFVWGGFAGFNAALGHCPQPLCDFVEHFYPMGKRVMRGKGPVQGFFYPPFFGLLLRPLGLLSLEAATVCWGLVQASLVAALWWSPRALWRQPFDARYLAYTAVLGSSYPVLLNLKWGQVSVLLAVAVLYAFAAYGSHDGPERRRIVVALLLAFALSIKLYPAVFLLPFLLARDGRVLGGAALFAVLFLGLLPVLALGWDATLNFYEVLARRLERVSENTGLSSQYFRNVLEHWSASVATPQVFEADFPAALHGARPFLERSAGLLRTAGMLAGYAVLALNALCGVLLWRRRPERELAWWFLLLSCSLPFLTPTSWPHYFVFLPVCQLLVLRELGDHRHGTATAVCGTLLLSSVALASIFAFNGVGSWRAFNFYGVVAFANLLLLATAYVVLVPILRKEGVRA